MGSDKHPATTSELLESLRRLREDNPKAVKPTVHLYPTSIYAPELQDDQASSSSSAPRKITSWKMTEHMYFQSNNNFPTLARGLFTEEVDGEERIVARGYDKFFNTDEVAWSYVSPHMSRISLTIPVGWDETSYRRSLSPHVEIKRLLDPHFGSFPKTPGCRLEAFAGYYYRDSARTKGRGGWCSGRWCSGTCGQGG